MTCTGLTSSMGSGKLSALPSAVPYLSLGEDLWGWLEPTFMFINLAEEVHVKSLLNE